MKPLRVSRLDAIRASIAGARAVASRAAAHVLFEAGGRKVMPAAMQHVVRGAVERQASRALALMGIAEGAIESGAARAATVQGVRAAGRTIARGVGTAAAAGALVDGGWALVQSMRRVRAGTMTRDEATRHVVREASTGAAATAAGTAAAALLITMTGGIATPAVFFVAAATSIGAKAGIDAWLHRRAQVPAASYARLGPSQRSTSATD